MGLVPDAGNFFSRISPSLSAYELTRLNAAWELARAAHTGQLRQSGEPYVTHPLAVAELVYELVAPDVDALCAALLHDVVEDSDTLLSSIETQFGPQVARIVDGVSKLDQVGTATLVSTKEETLRKLIAAGGRDWRVFAVKLCDRLHNMRTLGAVGADKRRRVAAETYSVFFPLARYVGFHRIATELESLSLRSLYPVRWRVIEKWCRYKWRIDKIRLGTLLDEIADSYADFQGVIPARVHHEIMVRGFQRLREDRACRAVFAIPVVFFCCDSIADAYRQIGELHSRFLFVPASFHSDASEGFVSTKVLLAQRGLVAEFLFLFPAVARAPWIRAVSESASVDDFVEVASARDPSIAFTHVLRELVGHNAITVFSPKGRRLSLPRHATGLDFAFAIHTDLGLRAKAVRVNGVLRPATVELSAGDIVEIIASNTVLARPEWQSALRSPRSRSKLRVWLRDIARQEAIELGKRLLSDAAGLTDDYLLATFERYGSLAAKFAVIGREDLYQRIGSGQLSAFAVASALKDAGSDALIAGTTGLDTRNRILLDGLPVRGLKYCDVCKPIPDDDILAVSSFAGAKVHRNICPQKAEGRSSNDFFTPAWAARLAQALPVDVRVLCDDRKGLLADCARAVSDCNIDVTAVSTLSKRDMHGTIATLEFTLLIMSRAKLERCLTALAAVGGVKTATRSEPEARYTGVYDNSISSLE